MPFKLSDLHRGDLVVVNAPSIGGSAAGVYVVQHLLADGVTGWAEVTTSEGPFFNSETPETAWLVIRGFLAPLVLGKNLRCASEVPGIFGAIRGHEMARADLFGCRA